MLWQACRVARPHAAVDVAGGGGRVGRGDVFVARHRGDGQPTSTPISTRTSTTDFPPCDLRWYALGSVAVVFPVFLGFLKYLGMNTTPWYYLLPLALAGERAGRGRAA